MAEEQNLDTTSAPQAEPAPESAVAAEPEEKLLKQSEVNKIVGGVKSDAYEKGRREALAELERQKALTADQEQKPTPTPEQITLSRDELNKVIDQRAEERAQQAHAEKVAEQFIGKMLQGKEKYQDFEDVVAKLNISKMPGELIDWANSVDNTADVMYELAKNPSKFANVVTLCDKSPYLAYDEFARLSQSIKQNEEAKKQNAADVNEPLRQIKPSVNGKDDGTLKTVSDLRKQSWLRG